MSSTEPTFTWTVETQSWPPHGRPTSPFGPTTLEVMRSCPLRSVFDVSAGYERRTGFAARVGIAFHRTLQSLSEHPPTVATPSQVAEEGRRRFLLELERQKQLKATRPREATLPWDEERINRATEAIMVEALRLVRAGLIEPNPDLFPGTRTSGDTAAIVSTHQSTFDEQEQGDVETEVPVKSADDLFNGRVDCAEHALDGTRLYDYKSVMRDDLPERYERQLQMYALLWHETRGEWPVAAQVVYPFTASAYSVKIAPDICERVGNESRALVAKLQQAKSKAELATPGDVCKACEYRPWCQPFWRNQRNETNHKRALEHAAQGFEGTISSIAIFNGTWKLELRWRNCNIRLVAPVERFPYLKQAQVGMQVRALDMRLQGNPYQPQAVVTEYSELFLLALDNR